MVNPFARRLIAAPFLIASIIARQGEAQTTLNGSALALRSNGSASGSDWLLGENGYVGTYVTLAAPGDVTVAVQASAANGGGAANRMNIVVGDSRAAFDVGSGFSPYVHTFSLPAGTHFIRTEYTNDFASSSVPVANRSLTVRNLSVTGAAVSNVETNANALAAADTYIRTGRQGAAHLQLEGVAPGAAVEVHLKQHAFNWGANVYGTAATASPPLSNPQFTQFFKDHFNAVVPSRAGKWNNNEATRDVVTNVSTGYLNSILTFAEQNGMTARMHNLIWGDDAANEEQPAWAVSLLASGTTASANDLRGEISERIDYYVGDGPGGYPEMAPRYSELDVYNESWHTGVNTPTSSANYWDRFGATGIAGIYEETAAAVAAAGANTKLYLNEYNVLQNGNDAYGNWYRQHIESIQNANGDASDGPVSGVGMQLYPVSGFSAAYMHQVLEGLAVTGLPQTITEFGVQNSVTDPAVAKQYVLDALRMAFGAPDMNTFMYWGFWAGATSNLQSASVLTNADWSLTDIGKAYEDLLGIHDWDGDPSNGWTTNATLAADADGVVDFTGFYGKYVVTVNGKNYALSLAKGTNDYAIVVSLSADFNNDGVVDSADLAAWGGAFGPAATTGDADADGDADGADFLTWQRQFGRHEATPLSVTNVTTVAEPEFLPAAALLSCGLAELRRTRQAILSRRRPVSGR